MGIDGTGKAIFGARLDPRHIHGDGNTPSARQSSPSLKYTYLWGHWEGAREVNGPFVQLLLNSDEASEARCTRYVAELRIETVDMICEYSDVS